MLLTSLGQETLRTLRRQRFHQLPLRLAVLRTFLELAEFSSRIPTREHVAEHLQQRRHVPVTVDTLPARWLENISDLVAQSTVPKGS